MIRTPSKVPGEISNWLGRFLKFERLIPISMMYLAKGVDKCAISRGEVGAL